MGGAKVVGATRTGGVGVGGRNKGGGVEAGRREVAGGGGEEMMGRRRGTATG